MANNEQVKVLGARRSPFSCRVEIALKLKGVEYEFIQEDLSNKSPALLKYNPVHKKVPVLVHNENPIAESLIIVEYIDETWKGTRILPEDPYDRAIARFWSKFVDDKCTPALMKFIRERECEEEAREVLKILEKELEGKKFFGGNEIGFVDIAAVFIAYWLKLAQEGCGFELLTEEKFPKLCGWADDLINVATIKESLPPSDDLLNFFRSRFPAPK